jgi:hypothetical protein
MAATAPVRRLAIMFAPESKTPRVACLRTGRQGNKRCVPSAPALDPFVRLGLAARRRLIPAACLLGQLRIVGRLPTDPKALRRLSIVGIRLLTLVRLLAARLLLPQISFSCGLGPGSPPGCLLCLACWLAPRFVISCPVHEPRSERHSQRSNGRFQIE